MSGRYGHGPPYNPNAPSFGGVYPSGVYPAPPPAATNYHPHSVYPPPPSRLSVSQPQPPHRWGGQSSAEARPFYWVDWNANRMVPSTAVRGGTDRDGSAIFVGRAFHDGDWIPAKVIPDRHIAYVAHGGGEHMKHEFQVLCEQRFDWVPTSGGSVPPGAVEGGRTGDGEPLYIGRVWHDGAHTVGKVHPSHGCLYIPYDSTEMSFRDYEILVLHA